MGNYILENKRYELLSAATITEGELKSAIFEELKLDLEEILDNIVGANSICPIMAFST